MSNIFANMAATLTNEKPAVVAEKPKKVNNKKKEEAVAKPAEVVETVVTEVKVDAAPKKADIARAIFNECYKMNPVPARKDIINRFVTEAGLTPAGAATYLQNFKTKAGLVNKK